MEAALSARKMRARAALLDTLGVEALDGAPEREPFRSRHRALEAPLRAEKISEVSPAFRLGLGFARARARVREGEMVV